MVTAVLPGFLTILGIQAAALGAIEGVADSLSSFVRLGGGWISDRFGHRKAMAVGGYLVTGVSNGLFAAAYGWPLVLGARALGWLARGFRSPICKAILADSVAPGVRGKAFGFERAGDTVGAVVGPLFAVGLLAYLHPGAVGPSGPFRIVFLLALIPGLGAAAAFAVLVRDRQRTGLVMRFWATLKALPRPFRRFLWGAGIFGMGDCARTLMILAATQLLTPSRGLEHAAQIAALLYVGHNVTYSAYSYVVGALSDRWGRRGLLALGYGAGALTALGFLGAFEWRLDSIAYLLGVFASAGFSIAAVDTLEGAMTADMVGTEVRGTAYGVLASVNGVGDLVASVSVGVLWTAFSPKFGFAYGALLMGLGAFVLWRVR